MSQTKYLELDSSYRDRNLYPLPSSFTVNVSVTGSGTTKINAHDPVSTALPIKKWIFRNFELNSGTTSTELTANLWASGATTTYLGESFTTSVVHIETGTAVALGQVDNYYNGAVIVDTTTAPDEYRRIVKYSRDFYSTGPNISEATIVLDKAFSNSTATGDVIEIRDPTDLSDLSNPLFFVPDGSAEENAYVGYLLYVPLSQESRPILSYDAVTRIIRLDTSGSVTSTSTSGPITAGNWTTPLSTQGELWITKNYPILTTTVASLVSPTVVRLTAGSTNDDIYIGDFLYIRNQTSFDLLGEYRRIIAYDGTNKDVTVSSAYTSFTPAVLNEANILAYTKDNECKLTSSNVLRGEHLYEIELLNLILPNLILNVSDGSRAVNYPYLYVHIGNVGSSNISPLHLSSNNPNAVNKLFKVPCDDVPSTDRSPFLKLDGDGTIQTVMFDFSRAINISVHLPDGSIFQTIETDTLSGTSPNSSVQVSACFAFRKLDIKFVPKIVRC